MKAFGFEAHGGLEQLKLLELPEPTAGPGEVRVRVKASSLNHLDLFTLAGIEGVKVPLPHALAGDGSGVIDQIGDGVERVRVGDRVLIDPGLSCGNCEACRAGQEPLCRTYRIVGEHTQGTAAEAVVVPAQNVVSLPDRLDFVQGAAPALVFMTAYRALMTVGELQPGETCAIIGAGGGLSTAAVQLAHWRGARVIVTSRTQTRAERVRALGADEVLVPTPERSLGKGLWELSGKKGLDVILDCTGRATFSDSVKALARGGRVVFCGATTGPLVEIDLRTLFWRNASIRGSTMATRAEFARVVDLLAQGAVKPVVDQVFPLAEGAAAVARLAQGAMFGKIVIAVP